MKTTRALKPSPATTTETKAAYPRTRLRRNRAQDWTRRMVSENAVTASDLIKSVGLTHYLVRGGQQTFLAC